MLYSVHCKIYDTTDINLCEQWWLGNQCSTLCRNIGCMMWHMFTNPRTLPVQRPQVQNTYVRVGLHDVT